MGAIKMATRPTRSRYKSSKLGWALLAAVAFWVSPTVHAADEEVSVTDAIVADHHYQLGLSSSVRAMQGSFDAFGAYHAFPDGSAAVNTSWNIAGSYRLSRLIELGTSVPLRISRMTFPTGNSTTASINSPGMDARIHVGGWPHLVVHVGGSLPWKYHSMTSAGDPGASMPDDLGDGMVFGASMRVGAGVSRSFGRFRVAMDSTETHPFASTGVPSDAPPGYTQQITTQGGDRISFSEGVSYLVTQKWSVNGGFRQYWSGPSYASGLVQADTRTRSFSTNLGVSYLPGPNWRVNGGFETQYPFYAYAVGIPYAPAVSLGMSYVGI